jgi:hypothetical protein
VPDVSVGWERTGSPTRFESLAVQTAPQQELIPMDPDRKTLGGAIGTTRPERRGPSVA